VELDLDQLRAEVRVVDHGRGEGHVVGLRGERGEVLSQPRGRVAEDQRKGLGGRHRFDLGDDVVATGAAAQRLQFEHGAGGVLPIQGGGDRPLLGNANHHRLAAAVLEEVQEAVRHLAVGRQPAVLALELGIIQDPPRAVVDPDLGRSYEGSYGSGYTSYAAYTAGCLPRVNARIGRLKHACLLITLSRPGCRPSPNVYSGFLDSAGLELFIALGGAASTWLAQARPCAASQAMLHHAMR